MVPPSPTNLRTAVEPAPNAAASRHGDNGGQVPGSSIELLPSRDRLPLRRSRLAGEETTQGTWCSSPGRSASPAGPAECPTGRRAAPLVRRPGPRAGADRPEAAHLVEPGAGVHFRFSHPVVDRLRRPGDDNTRPEHAPATTEHEQTNMITNSCVWRGPSSRCCRGARKWRRGQPGSRPLALTAPGSASVSMARRWS